MSDLALKKLTDEIEMLSFADRLTLLNKIVQTLQVPVKNVKKESTDFDAAFGLWAKRDISLPEIRQKAWSRN